MSESDSSNRQTPMEPSVDKSPISENGSPSQAIGSRQASESSAGNLITIAWLVIVVGIVAVGFINENVENPIWRMWIYVAIVALILGGAILYFRKFRPVAEVANFLGLLLSGAIPLLLAILFAQTARFFLLKAGAVLFLSVLPGWLYLQFVAVRGKTLQDEYILHLYRLHIDHYCHLPLPPRESPFYRLRQKHNCGEAKTLADNLYLRKFEGVYGRPTISGSRENLLPILFMTLLVSVVWTVILAPEVITGLDLVPGGLVSSGLPALPGEALAFGFTGAYFFILQMLARRYFQNDLKTSAYINGMMRIIIVLLLVTVVDVVWPWSKQQEKAFAFLVGIFPQIALQAIQIFVTYPLRLLLPSLKKEYPLSQLDGLNVWYESRLLEEGIEDMQNLATVNLADAILHTRVPVGRLVDWVDQAHLYLRVPKESRSALRYMGIRTATDLLAAYEGGGPATSNVTEQNDLGKTLAEPPKPTDQARPSITQAFLKVLEAEPNIYHIREWKKFVDQIEQPPQPSEI